MKKFILLAIAIFTIQLVQAQSVDISVARTTPLGQTVTVTGIVTNGAELGVIRYMQDATGGLPVYDPSFAGAINRGDEVEVTGTMDQFGGLLELTNVTWTVLSTNNPSPTPVVVTPLGISIANEGQLLKVNNVTFSNPGGTFTNGTLNFSDGTETSQIYLRSGSPLIGTIIPQTAVNITGLSSQFNGSAQFLLRDLNDIEIASTFYVSTGIEQSNLTTSGFDLSWETNANGISHVQYGLTEAMGTHVSSGSSTSMHSVSLTGLTAGEIYYAQAYAVNGIDTAWSVPKVYATVSNSTGVVEVYFNQPVNTGVNDGTPATYISGANLEAKIIQYIDNAQTSIDLAVYNQNRPSIVTALNNAVNRGVMVRVIADDGTANLALQTATTNFNWFAGNANGLMHNKFLVIDANSVNDSWVFMGSMNFTPGEVFDNYNNVIFIQDQSLAKSYKKEFEEMWGTSTANPGIFSRRLGADKEDDTPHKFVIGGIEMESYFSPSDGTTAAISKALKSADSDIEFALLTFTRNDLRDDLIDRHNAGVNIRGMIENINDTGGEFQTLVNAGISVRDDSVAHLLHHKYGIVDEEDPSSNPLVITGSHNWTSAAENNNDENTLIIHDATIANLYAQEFSARWIGIVTNTENVVSSINNFDVKLLGNPIQNELRFEMQNEDYEDISLQIFDIKGQLLKTETLINIAGTTNHTVNLSDLTNGNYIIVFQVDGLAIGQKFSVMK